jgi:hypothetical protein
LWIYDFTANLILKNPDFLTAGDQEIFLAPLPLIFENRVAAGSLWWAGEGL